jgi:IS5 family transposase
VRTIAGRLVRELQRKLAAGKHAAELVLFGRVLAQKKKDKNKIYSLHSLPRIYGEPEVKVYR